MAKAKRRVPWLIGVLGTCLGIFLPLRLHYFTDLGEVAFFTTFAGLGCLVFFLRSIIVYKLRVREFLKREAASKKNSEQEAPQQLPPSAGTVLSAKHHYHKDTSHYHEELLFKENKNSADDVTLDELPAPYTTKNPYCPLAESKPLLRVPYTCPLFEPDDEVFRFFIPDHAKHLST